MSSLLIRKDPYLIMCSMFHYQTSSLVHQCLASFIAINGISHLVNDLPYKCWISPRSSILWRILSFLKVIAGQFMKSALRNASLTQRELLLSTVDMFCSHPKWFILRTKYNPEIRVLEVQIIVRSNCTVTDC